MIRTKLAKKVLNKKDQKHLTESGINSIKKMKVEIEFQKDLGFPCHECSSIAFKLGLK